MHITTLVLTTFGLFWGLPIWLSLRYAGFDMTLFITTPVLLLLSAMYHKLWHPRNWAWVRDHWIGKEFMYDVPVETRGPNAHFAPEAGRRYIVAVHPHGLYPIGVAKHFVLNLTFLHFRVAVHWLLASLPVLKELTGWAGCINATWEDMEEAMADKDVQGLVVCPGSMREGLIDKGKIVSRTGYLKMAINHRAWVVPVYDADANEMYQTALPFGTMFHRLFRYPWPVVAWGRGRWFNPWPAQRTVRLFIGHPIYAGGRELESLGREVYGVIGDLREMAQSD